MNTPCQQFRIDWLSAEPSAAGHASTCAACAAWVRGCERARVALGGLGRLAVPAELELRVAQELSGDRSRRLERLLESSVRRNAPALLDERVRELLSGAPSESERGPHKAQALRALDLPPVPPVLERLIEEELAAPERHRAERISLGRLRAPEILTQRVRDSLRRKALTRLVLGPLLTLSAAGLVLWLSTRTRPEEHEYRFRVTQASSLDGLDPMARALAESLIGNAGTEGTPR